VPQNESRLERHERRCVLRNKARGVVRCWAIGRGIGSICEGTCRPDEAFAATHSERDWVLVFLRLRVQFDPHGIGIDIIKKSLNVK
jgi:hypothetical protein